MNELKELKELKEYIETLNKNLLKIVKLRNEKFKEHDKREVEYLEGQVKVYINVISDLNKIVFISEEVD